MKLWFYKIGALIFLPFFIFSFSQVHSSEWVVSKINGEAFIDGKALKLNDKAAANSELESKGVKAFLELKRDDEIIRLYGGKMKLDPSDSLKGAEKSESAQLFFGQLFLALKKIKDTGKRSFKVKTATATMGVRGTKFFVEANPDKTYLCVCEGKVEARHIDGNMKSAMVAAGDDLDIRKDGDKLIVKKAAAMMIDLSKNVFLEMGVPVVGI